jgi:hypothetical protein
VRGVFDIETEHWDTFVVGGMYDFDSGYIEDWNESSFADRLFASSGEWYAHNGGKFDFLWLLQEAERRGVKSTPIVAGQRIVKLTIDDGDSETPLVFLDSAAVWPMSLERFTGGKKKRTALPCVCLEVSHCGGYCSIARGMPGDLRARLSEYLRADVVELHAAITTFLGYASSKGLDIKTTIGASAWKFAARFAELPNAEWESIEYKFVRDAYYGGRTEVYKTRSDFGFAYDINSAYPAALTDLELPTGARREVTGRNAAAPDTRDALSAPAQEKQARASLLPDRARRGNLDTVGDSARALMRCDGRTCRQGNCVGVERADCVRRDFLLVGFAR